MFNILHVILRLFYIIYVVIKFRLFLLILNEKSNILSIFTLNIQTVKIGIEKLGPIFIKLGQILSSRNDILNKELINEFEKLQSNVKFINFSSIRPIIEEAFKMKIENIFLKFNENPLSSASIAQIHTGILLNGDKVIIKILKPGIKKIIKCDLSILRICFWFLAFFKKNTRFKLLDILLELDNIFIHELNFKYEASYISKFKDNLKINSCFYAPNVYWNLTSDNVLTLEYLDGINILNIDKFIKEDVDLNDVINKLFEIFYLQFLKHNFFHADLHPGNILISKNNFANNIIIFFDFGIVSFINNYQKYYLIENILAFIKKDYKTVIQLHLNAGTIITDKSIEDIECELRFIFDPILDKGLNNISIQKILGTLMHFSRDINMQIQPKLILFQKTLLSIESISRQLNPQINLWDINKRVIEKILVTDIVIHKILTHSKVKYVNKQLICKNKSKVIKHTLAFHIMNFLFSFYFFYFLMSYCYILMIFIMIIEYYNYLILFM